MSKKKNKPCGYEGFDKDGEWQCKLICFSNGSYNFSKRYETEHGYLCVWEASEYNLGELETNTSISTL